MAGGALASKEEVEGMEEVATGDSVTAANRRSFNVKVGKRRGRRDSHIGEGVASAPPH